MDRTSRSYLLRQRLSASLARIIVHRPWRLLVVTGVILALCAWVVASRQRLDSEVLNLLPQESAAVQGLGEFNAEFRQGKELMVALYGDREAVLDFEEQFVERLRAEPWVKRVFAGSPMEMPEEITALQSIIPQLLLNLPPEEFQAALASLSPEALQARVQRLQQEVQSNSPRAEMEVQVDPLGVVGKAMAPMKSIYGMEQGQVLTSADGTLKLFPLVTTQETLGQAECKAVMAQVEKFRESVRAEWKGPGPAPEVLVTGRTAYVAQIAHSMERDVSVTSLISVIAVTGLFLVAFRRLVPPLATTLILSLSVFVAFTLGCLIFENLNMIAIAFCSILVGLGDDFSLLLYNHYLLARSHREEHEQAIATSIREVAPGILWVALTTGAGFLVLQFSGSSGFAQLGTLIAIGVCVCAVMIITLFFVFIRPTHTTPDRPDALHGLFAGLVKGLLRYPVGLSIPMVVLAVAALIFALGPVQPLAFDTNPRSLEPKQIPGAIALRTITEKIPASSEPVMLLLNATDAQTAHDHWQTLDKQMAKLVEQGLLKSYSSPAALILSPERLRANREALKTKLDIPASRDAFRQALEMAGFQPEAFTSAFAFFDRLQVSGQSAVEQLDLDGVLPDSSSWWFLLDRYLATKPLLGAAYLRPAQPITTADAQQALEHAIQAANVPVKVTGWSYAMVGLTPWAKREVVVFGVAVGALILFFLALAYRHWIPLLVHVGSLVFALSACICLLKLTGTRINMLNALAFPLVLGVGVDYGMHLLLALREEESVEESVSTVLKPLVISGLTTIAGFGALIFAQNPVLKGLGTMCALGVSSCLFASVFFAVPLMVLLSRGRQPGKVIPAGF